MSLHFTSFVNFVRSASMLRTVLNPGIGVKNYDDKLPFDSLSSPRYPPHRSVFMQKHRKSCDFRCFGGDKRDRTADLLNAMEPQHENRLK